MKKVTLKLLSSILVVVMLLTVATGCVKTPENPEVPTTETTTETTTIIVSDETQELADDTKQEALSGEEIQTPIEEIPTGIDAEEAGADELALEMEAAVEEDGIIDQEDISYDGTATGNGRKLLTKYTGVTYFSQLDSRWKNVMYSSHGDKSQTIGTSGCGPTSAAMVVSSSIGGILPTTMAKISTDNKFRSRDNGTEWAFWPFVADYFNFTYYADTNSFTEVERKLETDTNRDGISDYFVVASCGYGLFTTSGHYIVIIGDKNNIFEVYDPYLYTGKFQTASRKAAQAKVSGTSTFVSEANFKKYANAKHYWIFSNEQTYKKKPEPTTKKVTTTKPVVTQPSKPKAVTKYVKVTNKLNVRDKPNGKIVSSLKAGAKVTVYESKTGYSRIGTNKWVASKYLVNTKPTSVIVKPIQYKTKVGESYRLKYDTSLNTQGDFKGTKCNYYKLTECKVLKHYNTTVDQVKIVKTGSIRYVKVTDLKL